MSTSRLLTAMVLALAVAPRARASKHEIRWVLAHEPSAVFTQAARDFAAAVSKETKGDITVRVVSSKEAGLSKQPSPEEILALVSSGKVEMTQIYTTSLSEATPKLLVLDMPYLFRDHGHATKVLDGEIGMDLLASLAPHGLKGLAFTYSGGYRILPAITREIRKPSDVKGLRVRTTRSPVAQATLRALGAVPVPEPLYNLRELVKNGEIDAAESTLPRYADDHNGDFIPVINETNHSLFVTAVTINAKYFTTLSKEHQAALARAALQMALIERQRSVEEGRQVKKNVLASGRKFVSLTPDERAAFIAALKPIRKEFAPRLNGLVERIEETR